MTEQPTPQGSFADLTLQLTRLGLNAQDLGSAMQPVLDALITHTAAHGAGYFQWWEAGQTFRVRATSGHHPWHPECGLPATLPLIRTLRAATDVAFYTDTLTHPALSGFPALGVNALIAAPVHDRQGHLIGALLAHAHTPHSWTDLERALTGSVTGLLALLAARLDAEEREREAHESALRTLGLFLEARDAETHGHTDRVTQLAVQLGRALNLDAASLCALRWGAYLHDIGKIALPDDVLRWPGPFSPAQRERMRVHVHEGVALARQLSFLPQPALDVIAAHHERWDGSGYPLGQRGQDIPLPARIFAVCDVFDALTSNRPYKHAWSTDEALAFVQQGSGTHFDPQVVQALVKVLGHHAA
ncbi:HD domain-containing phosphohydrolase [Deinococcus depolymerans]|uniref:HD domain-containing protein n=1 Tax=Deinococcus depolymerans TaxID=392408 RepID=A0ABP3M0G2_9DEIO